ncbi:hypothetical protein [Mycolicibacterium thermoresistibile]
MRSLRPGWLVALCGASLAVLAFLPWLMADDGRANAIGGVVGQLDVVPPGFGVGQLIVLLAATLIVVGAMAARRLSPRVAATAALAISVLLAVLTMWYYRLYVHPPVTPGYGFYLSAGVTALAVLLSVWAMVTAWADTGSEKARSG